MLQCKYRKIVFIVTLALIAITALRFGWLTFLTNLDYKGTPAIVNGELDLSEWDFTPNQTLRLDGEWEFSPFKLTEKPTDTDELITVPGNWKEQFRETEADVLYGTYQLTILVNDSVDQTFAMRVAEINRASAFFINGNATNATRPLALNTEKFEPKIIVPHTVPLTPIDGKIHIAIQVIDDTMEGGITKAIRFGLDEAIHKRTVLTTNIQLLLFIFFLMHSLYAVILYAFGAKNKGLLYYALIMVFGLLTTIISDEKILLFLFNINYTWDAKLTVIAFIGSVGLSATLFNELFPNNIPRLSIQLNNFLIVCWILFAVIVPVNVMNKFSIFIMTFLVFSTILAIFILWKVARYENDVILLILSSTIVFVNIIWVFIQNGVFLEYVIYPVDLMLGFIFLSSFWFKRFFNVTKEANELANRLQKEHEKKDLFLQNTSHELRNPLHGMINLTQAMLDDQYNQYTEEQRSRLQILLRISRHLSQLVDNLLDMTRLKEQTISLNKRSFSPHVIVAGVIEIMRVSLEGRPVQISNKIPDDLPLFFGDEQRFTQIMYNLLQNAMKFTEKGTITVNGRVARKWAIIEVKDTGVGIPETDIATIFDAYIQSETKNFTSGQGIGIGLNICKQLVELHGGEIEAQSIYGKGTTLSFTFPLLQDGDRAKADDSLNVNMSYHDFPEIASTVIQNNHPIYPELTNGIKRNNIEDGLVGTAEKNQRSDPYGVQPKILVVDDDNVNLQVIRYLLETKDFQVITTDDPLDALRSIEEHPFDLVISDVMMPGMSGFELTRQIRKRYSAVELPILLLTARTHSDDIITGFQAGANDYLTKPIESWELRARALSLTKLKVALENHMRMEAAWLQSQIQPHFIFNTLNSIAALGMFDFKKMQELLEEFSNYLRLSFDFKNADPTVALSHELSLVRSYLYIEMKRFEDQLSVEWDLNPNLEFRLPPLTIQPLVENALKHGLLKKDDGGKIIIKISEEESHYTISVKDDGVGMTTEELEALRKNNAIPNKRETSSTRIGLKNINLRLKQLYNEQLHIESKLGEGTIVSFKIPKQNEKKQ